MSLNITRYIRNNTGSVKYYLGVPIQPGEFYQIPPSKYVAYSNLEELISDISSGDASISLDGVNVLTGLNNQLNNLKGFDAVSNTAGFVGDRLKVDAQVTTGQTSISNNLRIEVSGNQISLARVDETITDIYTYSGAGYLHGFVIDFDSDSVISRLEVDGAEIFNIDCDILDTMFSGGDGDGGQISTSNGISFDSSSNKLIFSPLTPLLFNSSVKIQAKSNSNSSSRDVDRYMVTIQKES